MAAVTDDFDVKIKVVFPYLTKSLPTDDNERINATGNFNFDSRPQVDTAQGTIVSESPEAAISTAERVDNLKTGLQELLDDFDRIQAAMKEKAKHITLVYDPELTKNEALASAEAEIFGGAGGVITYEMFEQVLAYHEKLNKYISHLSVENGGTLDSVA
jgi:O-acetylhomoserine/O-acetylserine sulfhydrylase-like pyridoxal-dependent enzyme